MKAKEQIKHNIFKTPENYFQNFNDELQIRIIEDKLNDKFGKNNPFIIPENYFQTFSVELKKETKKSGKIIQLLKPYISIAAGILIIFGIWQVILSNVDKMPNIADNYDTINNNLNFDDIILADFDKNIDIFIETEDIVSVLDIGSDETKETLNNVADEDEISDFLIDYVDENDFDDILASL